MLLVHDISRIKFLGMVKQGSSTSIGIPTEFSANMIDIRTTRNKSILIGGHRILHMIVTPAHLP